MSVFGGDSWVREAQYRKRRVDDLIADSISDGSSYKKLASGKYTCLVCPHNPVLDTSLVLSMHIKGSKHRAAESRLKEREPERQNEINKRIALSQNSMANTNTSTPTQRYRLGSKPLIEQTGKAASVILDNRTPEESVTHANATDYVRSSATDYLRSSKVHKTNEISTSNKEVAVSEKEAAGEEFVEHHLDFRVWQERELKFTAAGWKRDCHGGWYRDENVEFDSDEEDPNISLAQ